MDSRPVITAPMPYLTDRMPGLGGAIKQVDEDFFVEEVPLYPASGEGTHVYFQIEKRGLPTLAVIRHIARMLGRAHHEIGYAGLKDAHGVTRQWLSLEHEDPQRIASLHLGRVAILQTTRHRNKIKLGHLLGNRFAIRIRDAAADDGGRAQAIMEVLARRGVPNYFGPQRFGIRGDNGEIGRAVLTGDFKEALGLMLGRPGPADRGQARKAREAYDAGDFEAAANAWPRGTFSQQARICRALAGNPSNHRKAFGLVDRTLQRLFVSAWQSELFNRVLARRIEGIDHVMNGDLAWKHANGACFRVENAEGEQPRCAAFEISPTGPLFGRRMTQPEGEPGRLEAAILAESSLTPEQLDAKQFGKLDGARRPLRVPISDWSVDAGEDEHGRYIALAFFLPAGAYATNVVREVCKNEYDASRHEDAGGV